MDCTNPCIASLIFLALDLVIGPSGTLQRIFKTRPTLVPKNFNWIIWPGLEIHPNGRWKIGIWNLSNLNWIIWPGLEIHPKSRGKIRIWHFVKSQLGNQTRSGNSTKWSGKIGIWNLSNLNWIIRPGLEIHPNGRWKIGIWHFVKLQLGNQTRFGNSSKRLGKNWDLTLVRSQLGNETQFGNSTKRSGRNWDLTLVRSQLGNQTRFGNSSERSGKNWDLTLVKS